MPIKLQEIMTSFKSHYKWVLKAEGGNEASCISWEEEEGGI